ncbi:hypothetical protein [Ideonella livida]|uniref:Uncharacterized protein n=1 Tax=Ideonella livida TaxID=2707176 RepID=A0A7C9TIJ3_9BURK|nr:hypothetical protein [Ideonella livida]NDY90442.1 hypothetical protein [Ideonella livida]
MSLTHEPRLWLGWRKPAADAGPTDWPTFRQTLGQVFLPQTWRVMTRFGLMAYVPTVLTADDDAATLAWPDETALLVYRSREDYERHKADAEGQAYSDLHGEVFRFGTGARHSRSKWATAAEEPGKPLRRMPSADGAHFAQPTARISVLFLAVPPNVTPGQLLAICPEPDSEAVAWCVDGKAVVWLSSAAPLNLTACQQALQHAVPGLTVHLAQQATPVPVLAPAGVAVDDLHTWHMALGLTEVQP